MAASETLFQKAVSRVQEGQVPEDVAQDLLSALKDDERLWLLDGDASFWEGLRTMLMTGYNTVPIPAGTIERLGIPGLLFTDDPRGVVMGEVTAFPVSMARGATWDIALEQEVGLAIGREARALGANFFGGVCINLPRHPVWGRAQETYGEDPVLLGEFGAALTRGVQKNAMAIAKHFALNSMENARFQVDVKIDRSAKRILATQLRHYAQRDEAEPAKDVVGCKDHGDLARRVAARSMVLVKNEAIESRPLLPLEASSLRKVVIAGPLANSGNTGDKGSSNVHNTYVVTPYEGIKAALPNATVILKDREDAKSIAESVTDADVAILVVGCTFADEGEFIDSSVMQDPTLTALFPTPKEEAELAIAGQLQNSAGGTSIVGTDGAGGDRKNIRLKDDDVELIKATVTANPRTVVVIVTAGAVITEEWRSQVPAVLFGWYSGQEGGNALADVLLGKIDASGRLPYSIPTSEDHLLYYDVNAKSIVYDKWFGQRLLDHRHLEAAFPLGYGLSYTQFAISEASVAAGRSNHLVVRVKVSNSGNREGRQVIQVYGKQVKPEVDAVRQLLGFATVDLKPGSSEIVEVQASLESLKTWSSNKLVLLSESVLIEIGRHSGDTQALTQTVSLSDFITA
ncbi:hypothetical protein EAE96_001752 [Botrytis aclada]|nr:hypothetical protein EAE96_001752 [Botrytis aclada]